MSYKHSPNHFALDGFAALTRYSIYTLLVFSPLALGSVQGWAVTAIELVTLVALTAFLLGRARAWDWTWTRTPLDKPIICLLVLLILSALFSVNRNRTLWADLLIINYLVLFYLIVNAVRTRADFRRILWVVISTAAFLALFGLIKKYGTNPFPWWDYSQLIPETAKQLISTYGNRNHLAGYLEMALPLSLGLILTGYRGVRLLILILVSALLLLVLVLTFSRGGWISGASGMVFMVVFLMTSRYFNKKKVVMAAVGVGLALVVMLLSNTAMVERFMSLEDVGKGSGAGRMKIWGAVVEMIEDYPVFGVGPGNFSTVFTQYLPPAENRHYFAHNDYLQSVAEAGPGAIIVMAWMIWAVYVRGLRKLGNESRLVRGVTIGALSGITAMLIHSAIDFNLHIPANAALFTVLAGLVVSPLPVDNMQNRR